MSTTKVTIKPFVLISSIACLFTLSSCSAFPWQASGEAHEASSIVLTEEIIIGLLLVAAIVSIVTQRLRIPYTVGLVLVGFCLTLFGQIPVISVVPEIILALLVPPLVFEAAFHLSFSDLRRDLPFILVMAIPGVILTTLLVGSIVSFTAGIGLATALVFGALIAATDPVAVIALFRSIGVPKRLQVLLEGESLLNDGTAIVLFNLMVVIALTGHFSLASSIFQFIIVAGGGILVGVAAGFIVSQVIGRIDNYLIETTLTTVLAYGAYLIAEYLLGVSGVLAVVAAGLACGYFAPRGMSPTTRIVVFNFWEYAAFLANSFVFLLIGLRIDVNMLINNAPAIGWAILAVLLARAVTVYGLSWIGKDIPFKWQNVLFWGGLRGAISLALALSLTLEIPNRTQLQAMAFGVVLFTLLVEGLTMRPLVRRSGLIQASDTQLEYERRHARLHALQSAQSHIQQLNREGLISDYTWRKIQPILDGREKVLGDAVHEMLEMNPQLHQEELTYARREALRSERSTYFTLFQDNVISEEIYAELVAEVDARLVNEQDVLAEQSAPEEDREPNL